MRNIARPGAGDLRGATADAVAVICEGLRGDLIARGIDVGQDHRVAQRRRSASCSASRRRTTTRWPTDLGLAGAEVIGFIGSFYDYEGLDDLIAAMPELVAVAADGAAAAGRRRADGGRAARHRRRHRRSPRHIHFVGRVPHSEVERYYSLIDILAYPRKKMRLTDLVTPLKPLEAMAQRRLVAASDVGGHRELIRDGDHRHAFPARRPARRSRMRSPRCSTDRALWAERRRTARYSSKLIVTGRQTFYVTNQSTSG